MTLSYAKNCRKLDERDRRLLNDFQDGFPLTRRPYADIAAKLGISEREVIDRLSALVEIGAISRIGAVVRPHRVGWSTLAAIAVPQDRLENVAETVSSFDEVNHNYQREYRLNLWFVVTGADKDHVGRVLREIEDLTGLTVIDLPMEESHRLNLGFDLS